MPVIGNNQETIKEYLGPNELGRVYLGNTLVQNSILTYISASGGIITEDGDFKIHTFTTIGTSSFVIHSLGTSGDTNVGYLIIGGGGAGGNSAPNGNNVGGGAGGFLSGSITLTSSNLGTNNVIVGGGAIGGIASGSPGSPSGSFSSLFNLTAFGGGSGAGDVFNQKNGGSGAGTGITIDSNQGNNGGTLATPGGGGAGAPGGNGQSIIPLLTAGDGGIGKQSAINGTLTYYAGGGGGGGSDGDNFDREPGFGGAGGGGNGGRFGNLNAATGGNATFYGGGGGGMGDARCLGCIDGGIKAGNGFQGIVIVRYRFK